MFRLRLVQFTRRHRPAKFFSTSLARRTRAVTYSDNGSPADVVRVESYADAFKQPPSPPPAGMVNVRFKLSPVNPADINVIEGVYPSKPSPSNDHFAAPPEGKNTFIGGNEGLAEVTEVGSGDVGGLKPGDWVVMGRSQVGTWCTTRTLPASDVVRLDTSGSPGFSEVAGATIFVNPPTAWNMLHDFVDLKEGDWVVQNGANSAVGQAVVQIAAKKGWKTINFVRNRDNLSELVKQLEDLGATKVYTYDQLGDKAFPKAVKELTGRKDIRLALNCVGGKETTLMTRLLGKRAYLVSYGAMSKQPLSLPTSLFIFKDLVANGFWQTRWYEEHSRQEKETLFQKLIELNLKVPDHEIVDIPKDESNEAATAKVRETFTRLAEGRLGKKVLLRIA